MVYNVLKRLNKQRTKEEVAGLENDLQQMNSMKVIFYRNRKQCYCVLQMAVATYISAPNHGGVVDSILVIPSTKTDGNMNTEKHCQSLIHHALTSGQLCDC